MQPLRSFGTGLEFPVSVVDPVEYASNKTRNHVYDLRDYTTLSQIWHFERVKDVLKKCFHCAKHVDPDQFIC